MLLGDVENLDDAAKRTDDIEQGRAGWIHAERVEHQIRVLKQQRGAQEERR